MEMQAEGRKTRGDSGEYGQDDKNNDYALMMKECSDQQNPKRWELATAGSPQRRASEFGDQVSGFSPR